jgi:hypothetical protein
MDYYILSYIMHINIMHYCIHNTGDGYRMNSTVMGAKRRGGTARRRMESPDSLSLSHAYIIHMMQDI